jgi:PKHD-type hydroxylase
MKIFNIFSPEEAGKIYASLAGQSFADGKETAHGAAKDKKQNMQLSTSNKVMKGVSDLIQQKFVSNIQLRAYTYPQEFVGIRANSYDVGEHYDWHVDMGVMGMTRTDMSFTIFLTPKEVYEGGVLEMDFGTHKAKVKGSPGQVVIYSTGVLHRVTPVTQGRRLCVIGWIKSNVPSVEDREALFTLASEIGRIKSEHKLETSDKLSYVMQHMIRALSRT